MDSAFTRFPARLQEAIVSRLGWTALRPVQELASHVLLDDKNAVILAPTAGGKTEAAFFPMLARLMEWEPEGVGLLYIAPLRALLNNQAERLGTYTEMVGLRCFMWHGDVTEAQKRAFIREPTEVLMTTPESLEVMLLSPRVPHVRLFRDVRVLIVDEVHALAGTDRGAHLMAVCERLMRHTPNDVQRIGLSATVGNPAAMLTWLQGTSRRAGCVVDPPQTPSQKDIRIHLRDSLGAIAQSASSLTLGHKSLFFCQSRALTESMTEQMRQRGTSVFVHHSSVSREGRQAAEERFQHGSNACIICTSTLELGIDVGDLDLVLQANAPATVSSFLQRLGRTGRRAGQRATMTFFCEDPEVVLQAIALVELAKKHWVESMQPQTRCWPVLVHQLLALTLQFGAVSQQRCWEYLSVGPDFAGISRAEFDRLITHLITADFLFVSDDLLSMGDEAERIFGRKNFMELYAVFTTPQLYTVKTSTDYIVGSLEQAFVDTLVEEMSTFLLGGQAWTVHHVNHHERAVHVTPAPCGTKPSWGGFMPQLLGFEVCQQIAELLRSDMTIAYIDGASQTALDAFRQDLGPLLRRPGPHIQMGPGQALWWTFAGGRINHALKYGMQLQNGWKVLADNFRLKLEGDGLTFTTLCNAIDSMSTEAFWDDPSNQRRLLAQLPAYRLSKFQRALPECYALEMVSNYLLDIPRAIQWLRGEYTDG